MSLYNNTSMLTELLNKAEAFPRSDIKTIETILIERSFDGLFEIKNVLTIETDIFASCSTLTSVSFPQCTSIGSYAFYNCTALTSADFPQCTTIEDYAFASCSALTIVSFPQCTTIGSSAFGSCFSLRSVSFPQCSYIDSFAFKRCSALTSIFLMGSSLCILASSYAFVNAGITSSTGSIFVPASLVDAYKSATVWAYFSNRIFGKEG